MSDYPAHIHPAVYYSDTVLFIKMCAKQQISQKLKMELHLAHITINIRHVLNLNSKLCKK